MGAPTSGDAQWQLEGTLSTATPDDGRVRRPAVGSASAAADLAHALGLTGTPTAIHGGWALRGPSTTVLMLRADGSWSWSMDCAPDAPITSEDVNTGCAVASSSVPPGPPPGPSEADTLRTAAPVLSALGFATSDLRFSDGSGSSGVESTSTATVTPAVGWATSLEVSRSLDVVGGNGWLPGSTEGDAYPLISAADAFEALKAHPRPVMDLCMVRKDGQPGCEPIPPSVVTGATLGLSLDRDRQGALLVPTWLFTVKGDPEPATWIAVDPAYLEPLTAPDGPAPSDGGSGSGSSGSGGSSTGGGTTGGGTTDPAPPPEASPNATPAQK
jgi:hypothetical protein